MPPHSVGNYPARSRNSSVLRGLGFSLAIVLGAIAIWLIVTSTSQKRIEIGVLAGLWGLLLGAFSVFGSRHPLRGESAGGAELAVRGASELERADEAAARREFEVRLEHLLRREIQTSMVREVSGLRDEIASLRTELLDKVGGQLRLERIETTRVIGSDIEAIKREVSQLKGARLFGEPGDSSSPVTRITSSRVFESELTDSGTQRVSEPVRPVVPTRPAEPAAAEPREIHDAEVVEEPATGVFAQTPAPASPVTQDPAVPPVVAVEPAPAVPTPAPTAPVESEPEFSNDTFAGLPRLRPFTDFELDPIEPTPDPSAYSGRRRVDEAPEGPARHGASEGTGGRRRRRADGEDDVLSRILQRESAR